MSMEREYTVIANTREDLPALEADITASSGAGPIPSRSVDIANPRLGSKIQTHFMLTDDEAQELRKDPRVRAVEIPPEQRDDIGIGLNTRQSGNFYRGSADSDDEVNWGLRRCVEGINVYGEGTTVPGDYVYTLDGTGVDIVIQDSGIDPNHPEWEDAQGVSRLQQINWYTESGLAGTQDANFYTDYDGHGTHCAGIAAGKTYGWAKGARIYAQKLGGLEGSLDPGSGIPISDAFDTIRLWHINKGGTRPTVVNMSWGYFSRQSGDPTSGVYRGTPWQWGIDYSSNAALWTGVGIVTPLGASRRLPLQVASVDAEVEDMISDGVVVCIAAGNDFYKADLPEGDDYDNEVLINGVTRNYHRPNSPYAPLAFNVGNIESDTATGRDRPRASSKKGPAVNIWAPGTDIMSTSSVNYDTAKFFVLDYPDDPTYKIMSISGTSMAAPQVAGVCALYLQDNSELTPANLLAQLIEDCTPTVNTTTALANDYANTGLSILGSEPRHLYSRVALPRATFVGSAAGVLTNVTMS